MADEFKVEIPFEEGGRANGEKVTKQVGEKIVAELKKILKAVSVGKGTGAAEGGPKGLMGVSKGLKGVTAKLGALGVAIAATAGILVKSSPYLKGILDIFGRAFMIFFRPFGDFLATLLRPFAIMMMKMAVAFLKWTRTPAVEKVKEGLSQSLLPQGKRGLFGVLGAIVSDWFKALDFSKLKEFPGWLWDKIKGIWSWRWDFGTWLWSKVTSIWSWKWDFGKWLWNKVTSIFGKGGGGGAGGVSVAPQAGMSIDPSQGVWTDKGWFKTFSSSLAAGATMTMIPKGGFQLGTPSVLSDGVYKLHRGEQVIPRTRAGQNKSIIFRPIFQISGQFSKDIDMDAVVRRAGRMTEMDLKQRGVIT